MEKKINLICTKCGASFDKALREYKRQKKKGREYFFCSLSCSISKAHENDVYDIEKIKKNLVGGRRKPNELSPFKWFVLRAKQRHKRDPSKECKIDATYLKKLFEEQNGVCPLTGWDINLPRNASYWNDKSIKNASLDRIDNSKGYVPGNVRFVSVIANYARNKYEDSDVFEFCKAVVNRAG